MANACFGFGVTVSCFLTLTTTDKKCPESVYGKPTEYAFEQGFPHRKVSSRWLIPTSLTESQQEVGSDT